MAIRRDVFVAHWQLQVPARILSHKATLGQSDCWAHDSRFHYFSSRSTSPTSARKKGSTSVTRPTVWNEPRSESLITVLGLISTQTTLTQAGRRLPTAMEWSVVATIRQKVTSRIAARIWA